MIPDRAAPSSQAARDSGGWIVLPAGFSSVWSVTAHGGPSATGKASDMRSRVEARDTEKLAAGAQPYCASDRDDKPAPAKVLKPDGRPVRRRVDGDDLQGPPSPLPEAY